jgi:membrane protease YdiL (CAAX protease family)
MTFLREAGRGHKMHFLWYLLTLGVVFLGITVGQIPLIIVIQGKVAKGEITTADAQRFYEIADFTNIGVPSAFGLTLMLISFILGLVALFAMVEYMHGRRFKSLISSRPIRWDKVLFAVALWFALSVLGEFVMYGVTPEAYHLSLDWSAWIWLLLVALILLPLQTSFEELLIRGYLMQKIGIATNKAWLAVLLSSLLFGAMHLGNPEIEEFGLGVMMTYYVSVAICLAVITILDDGLEYALGIHAATNIYGAAFVGYEGSALQTDALVRVDEVDPVLMLVIFYIAFFVFLIIVKYRNKLLPWSSLFAPVNVQLSTMLPSDEERIDQINTSE